MMTALYTAVSGMDANSTALSMIGDNIANLNTIGFKGSTISFGDVLSESLATGGGASQIGLGVQVMSVEPSFTQGSLETTTSGLDLAINGDGFFMVNSGNVTYYTRAGQFSQDNNGNIVNPDGLILQGYVADAAGNLGTTLGNLQVGTSLSPANATTLVSTSANLDASATPPAAAFTLDSNGDGVASDPANYNFSNSVTVYDPQGGAHQVTQYFVKTGTNAWDVHYVFEDPSNAGQLMEAGQTTGGAGNPPTGAATVQALTFNTNGSLADDASGTAMTFNFGNGLAAQNISFNYGTGTAEAAPGTGLDMTTQYAGTSSLSIQNQDGYQAGSLSSLAIGSDGILSGTFTNGQTRTIGQVALARFAAPTELTKMGGNLYAASAGSGQAIIGQANSSGFGKVQSDSLELSNVDLAKQFVDMIAAQRGFQANSKVISTADQLMQTLLNLT